MSISTISNHTSLSIIVYSHQQLSTHINHNQPYEPISNSLLTSTIFNHTSWSSCDHDAVQISLVIFDLKFCVELPQSKTETVICRSIFGFSGGGGGKTYHRFKKTSVHNSANKKNKGKRKSRKKMEPQLAPGRERCEPSIKKKISQKNKIDSLSREIRILGRSS